MSSSPNILQVGAVFDGSALQEGMEAAAETTKATTAQMSAAFQDMAVQTEASMGEAKASMALLGEEIGVTVPRHLRTFIAELPGVSTAMSAAFSGIAVIALADLVLRVGEKLQGFLGSLNQLSDAEKTYHDQIVKDAQEELRFAEDKIKAEYAIAIAKQSGNDLAQQTLRVQMYTALVGASQKYVDQLKAEQQSLINMAKEHQQTADETLADMAKGTASEEAGADIVIALNQRKADAYKSAAQDQQKAIDEASFALQHSQAQEIEGAASVTKKIVQLNKQEVDASIEEFRKEARAKIDLYNEIAARAQQFSAQAIAADKEANDQIIADAKTQMADQAKLYEGDIADAKSAAKSKEDLAAADLAKGRITKQEEIQIIADAKKQEINLEIQAEKAIEALYDNEPKKVAEIELKIRELKAQARAIDAAAAKQAANADESRWMKQLQDWQNINKQMENSYLQMVNSMNSAITNFITTGKFNWQSMASSMISDIVRIGLQWAESQIAMKLLGISTAQTAAAAQISASASTGAAAAGASVAAIPIFGWSMVPEVTASTFSMLEAFQGSVAAFALGGIVPATGLAMVHQGETVLPASMSGTGLGAGMTVNLGGITLQGIDGASIKSLVTSGQFVSALQSALGKIFRNNKFSLSRG
jgi:lambda family phage tail tape measure protein